MRGREKRVDGVQQRSPNFEFVERSRNGNREKEVINLSIETSKLEVIKRDKAYRITEEKKNEDGEVIMNKKMPQPIAQQIQPLCNKNGHSSTV
jgi:hypothetical protein